MGHSFKGSGFYLQLSGDLVRKAAGSDLVVLEGMGRGIETNLNAHLTVDSLKLGMVKHKEVRQD